MVPLALALPPMPRPSMGPRLRSRGWLAPQAGPNRKKGLQWGRGLGAADGRRVSRQATVSRYFNGAAA